jgi:ketosteroid isomerase-like protein
MRANSPEEICRLFQRYMREGDLQALLTLYDREAVFLSEAGETKEGDELRRELAPFAPERASFDFNVRCVIRSGDVALMHTEWNIASPQHRSLYAVRLPAARQTGRGAG